MNDRASHEFEMGIFVCLFLSTHAYKHRRCRGKRLFQLLVFLYQNRPGHVMGPFFFGWFNVLCMGRGAGSKLYNSLCGDRSMGRTYHFLFHFPFPLRVF